MILWATLQPVTGRIARAQLSIFKSLSISGIVASLSPVMSAGLDVRKTYKLYIGGNFVRSESGRYLTAVSASGAHMENVCHASRKDFRDTVSAARSALEGWAKKTAYLRGQVLYRAAE